MASKSGASERHVAIPEELFMLELTHRADLVAAVTKSVAGMSNDHANSK
jgi:hypothetical protein